MQSVCVGVTDTWSCEKEKTESLCKNEGERKETKAERMTRKYLIEYVSKRKLHSRAYLHLHKYQ